MTNQNNIPTIRKAQNIATKAMDDIVTFIKLGMTEAQIAQEARRLMDQMGAQSYWYYDVAALVLVGERTGLSTSGRHYQSSAIEVQEGDLITIDLSPVVEEAWGDYARSIFVTNGKASYNPQEGTAHEKAIHTLNAIHDLLVKVATPDMSTHHLWEKITDFISQSGFQNADFRGNLGHTVEKTLNARRYLEKDCDIKLSDLGPFTFEPHIMPSAGGQGYKREDIYYFEASKLIRV